MKETLQIPTPEMLENLIGKELYNVWTSLCQLIEQKYNMEQLWNYGGKAWKYEYKYRRGGKTLCSLSTTWYLNSALFAPFVPFSTIFD